VVPGLNPILQPLVINTTLSINAQLQVVAATEMSNPFTAPIAVECQNFTIVNETGKIVAYILNYCFPQSQNNGTFPLPGKSLGLSQNVVVTLAILTANFPTVVNLSGFLSFYVPSFGGFHQYVDYSATNVAAKVITC